MLSLPLPPFQPKHEFFHPEDNQRRQSCELLSKTAARRKKCVEMVSRPSLLPLRTKPPPVPLRQRLEIDHSLGNQPLALFSCPKLGKTMAAAAVKTQELCSGAHHDVAL